MRRGVGIGAINKNKLQQVSYNTIRTNLSKFSSKFWLLYKLFLIFISFNTKQLFKEKLKEKATEISENEINQLTKQMETFKTNLQEFAFKYKDEIKRNSEFRKQFQDMCAHVGVDPLASSKGFFAEMLGVGDYYYELAVQIIEICNSMQERTGGLIYLDQIHERIQKVRSRFVSDVSLDDCRRAIKKLDIFGNAFTLIQMNNGRSMVNFKNEISYNLILFFYKN